MLFSNSLCKWETYNIFADEIGCIQENMVADHNVLQIHGS
jgi:hypothetical protein